jgi:hypothetical protein
MNKLARYTRRLILWFERPLPHEEWVNAFKFGEVSGRNKVLAELKALGFFNSSTGQLVQQKKLPPITIRQRVAMRKLRASLPPATIPPSNQHVELATLPVQHVELVDESWLNSTPLVAVIEEEEVQERGEDDTNKVPVISKLMHGGK